MQLTLLHQRENHQYGGGITQIFSTATGRSADALSTPSCIWRCGEAEGLLTARLPSFDCSGAPAHRSANASYRNDFFRSCGSEMLKNGWTPSSASS